MHLSESTRETAYNIVRTGVNGWDAWNKLKARYDNDDWRRASRTKIRNQIKLKKGEDIELHLDKLTDLFTNLETLDDTHFSSDEKLKLDILIGSIEEDSEYRYTLQSANASNLSYEQTCQFFEEIWQRKGT